VKGKAVSLKRDIRKIRRMLKTLIKLLEKKYLNPRIMDPFLPTNSHAWSGHNET
jgi:hypothetical protein